MAQLKTIDGHAHENVLIKQRPRLINDSMFSFLVNLSHVSSFLEDNVVRLGSCHSSFVFGYECIKWTPFKRLEYIDQG